MRHGAESTRIIERVAALPIEEVLSTAPWLGDPLFAHAVRRYGAAVARHDLLMGHITKVTQDEGVEAVPSRMWEQANSTARLCETLAQALGLTPASRAELDSLLSTAETGQLRLQQLRAEGRKLVEARAADVPGAPSLSSDGSRDAAEPERPGDGTLEANPGTEAAAS